MVENIPLQSLMILFKEEGIKRDITVPYDPQNNGVSERKNQTIVEASKSMMHDHILPMFMFKTNALIKYLRT